MDPRRVHAHLNSTISFRTGTGEPLDLVANDLMLSLWDEEPLECRLTLEVSRSQLEAIVEGGYFHLSSEALLEGSVESFSEDAPVELVIRLDAEQVEDLPIDVQVLGDVLAQQTLSALPLRDVGSWFAIQLKQQRGVAKLGFRTPFWDPAGKQIVTTGRPILKEAVTYMTGQEWYFVQPPSELSALKMKIETENGRWTCLVTALEERGQIAFYSVSPYEVAEERRLVMAELITRANSGLVIGNFEMNFDNGIVKYKTSIDTEGAELSQAHLEPIFQANLQIFSQYLPALKAVALEGADALQAIALAEG